MENLAQVKRAAAKAARSRAALEAAMRSAHQDGAALRKIADAAGMSHESVRRLIRSDQA